MLAFTALLLTPVTRRFQIFILRLELWRERRTGAVLESGGHATVVRHRRFKMRPSDHTTERPRDDRQRAVSAGEPAAGRAAERQDGGALRQEQAGGEPCAPLPPGSPH